MWRYAIWCMVDPPSRHGSENSADGRLRPAVTSALSALAETLCSFKEPLLQRYRGFIPLIF